MKYKTKKTIVKTKSESWNYLLVEIFTTENIATQSDPGSFFYISSEEDVKIGEYTRNYSNFYDTFYPFTYNGRDYALYSSNYDETRLMELPSCINLGAEESRGFCPTQYYIPKYSIFTGEYTEQKIYGLSDDFKETEKLSPLQYENFGFVAGCVWGDDWSYKIEFLDLSYLPTVKRDNRFGYIVLPENLTLDKAIKVHDCYINKQPRITISNDVCFKFSGENIGC